MKIRLKPISPKRISDQVFDQLRELIYRGDYQPGQKIMTERELAEALSVSRNSVREAINKLVTLRFLEQRQGQGTFVRSIDEAIQIPLATVMETQDATLIDVLEMRMGIECTAASLAAQRINAAELERIEKALREMERDTRAGGLGTEFDLAFHMAIAAATILVLAAIFAPLDEINHILPTLEGYVVLANINSRNQVVIGGAPASPEWAETIGADAYAENANEAVDVVKQLMEA